VYRAVLVRLSVGVQLYGMRSFTAGAYRWYMFLDDCVYYCFNWTHSTPPYVGGPQASLVDNYLMNILYIYYIYCQGLKKFVKSTFFAAGRV